MAGKRVTHKASSTQAKSAKLKDTKNDDAGTTTAPECDEDENTVADTNAAKKDALLDEITEILTTDVYGNLKGSNAIHLSNLGVYGQVMSMLEQDKADRERLEAILAGEVGVRCGKRKVRKQSQKERLEILEAKLEEVTSGSDVLRDEVNGYKKSAKELSEQAKILRNDKSVLTKELRAIEKRQAALEREKIAVKEREAVLQKENTVKRAKITNMSLEVEKLTRENAQVRDKLRTADKHNTVLDKQVAELKERLEELAHAKKEADPALSPLEIAKRTKHMTEVSRQARAVGPYMFVHDFVILIKLGDSGIREYNGKRRGRLLEGLGDSHIDRVFEMMKNWDMLNLRKRDDGTLSVQAVFEDPLPADVMEATFGEEMVPLKM